jgi:cobyrinic acid a,c-diamide synthase
MLKNSKWLYDPCMWSFVIINYKYRNVKLKKKTLILRKINIHKFHHSKCVMVKILNTENGTFLERFSVSRVVYRHFERQ